MGERTSIALLVALTFVLVTLPIILLVLAWRAWHVMVPPSNWRKRITFAGIAMESVGATAMPILMLILETHNWAEWIARIQVQTMNYASLTGIAASVIAIPLVAFAWGKIRWLTLPACLMTLGLSFIAGMAMSY